MASPVAQAVAPAAVASSAPSSNGTAAPASRPAASSVTESLKDRGNRAFVAGDYARAVSLFTDALECIVLAPDSGIDAAAAEAGVDAASLHILYSNRSAAYFQLKQHSRALADAEEAVLLRPEWAKGHLRRGTALEALLQFPEAAAAYAAGLERDPADAALISSADTLGELLKELKLGESQLSKSAHPDSDRFSLMVQWMKDGGAQFPKLFLQFYSEDYRGVHSLAKIAAEEIILYVPYHMVLTSEVAMESGIGRAMVEARLELRSKHSYLAAYLLQERAKGSDSYWAPYIACLPRVYASMPIFFGPELLRQLKGSMTLTKIRERIASLQAEYATICAAVPAMTQFTKDDFVWARLAVITRIFGMVIRGVKTDGLVAMADMLNHKRPVETIDSDTRWTFSDQLDGFTITSTRTIDRGEQVYDSYGRKCNSRFFVNYGFALDNNEDDNEAVLRFACPPDAVAMPLKTKLAGGRNLLALKEFQVPATYRDTSDRERKSREMFSWLRLMHATETELAAIQAADAAAGGPSASLGGSRAPAAGSPLIRMDCIDPVSTRNEAAVLAHVQRAAREALSEFDNTLEADDAMLLANSFPDSNVRNCVIQRRGEKQVLRWWEALAKVAGPLLPLNWVELRKHAPKFMTSSARDFYVTHCVATLVKRGA